MNNRFTNELYDVAAHEDMGFDALHVMGPDEIVMAMEELGEVGVGVGGGFGGGVGGG